VTDVWGVVDPAGMSGERDDAMVRPLNSSRRPHDDLDLKLGWRPHSFWTHLQPMHSHYVRVHSWDVMSQALFSDLGPLMLSGVGPPVLRLGCGQRSGEPRRVVRGAR
jgi:hypothetical protein